MKKSTYLAAAAAAATVGTTLLVTDLYRYVFYRTRSRFSRFLLEKPGHEPAFYEDRERSALVMDALTHAVEAYVCWTYNTEESIRLAEEAVCEIFTYLERAYRDGNDMSLAQQ